MWHAARWHDAHACRRARHGAQGHAHDDAYGTRPGHAGRAPRAELALALTAGFAVVEAIGGWMAGSLALFSDAGHMLTDAARSASRCSPSRLAAAAVTPRSYGYGRAEVLAAFVNAHAMLALVALIAIEAVAGSSTPRPSPAAR